MTYSCIKKEKMEWEFKPRTSQIEEFWTVNRGVFEWFDFFIQTLNGSFIMSIEASVVKPV